MADPRDALLVSSTLRRTAFQKLLHTLEFLKAVITTRGYELGCSNFCVRSFFCGSRRRRTIVLLLEVLVYPAPTIPFDKFCVSVDLKRFESDVVLV
jgi:hypothetical protein